MRLRSPRKSAHKKEEKKEAQLITATLAEQDFERQCQPTQEQVVVVRKRRRRQRGKQQERVQQPDQQQQQRSSLSVAHLLLVLLGKQKAVEKEQVEKVDDMNYDDNICPYVPLMDEDVDEAVVVTEEDKDNNDDDVNIDHHKQQLQHQESHNQPRHEITVHRNDINEYDNDDDDDDDDESNVHHENPSYGQEGSYHDDDDDDDDENGSYSSTESEELYYDLVVKRRASNDLDTFTMSDLSNSFLLTTSTMTSSSGGGGCSMNQQQLNDYLEGYLNGSSSYEASFRLDNNTILSIVVQDDDGANTDGDNQTTSTRQEKNRFILQELQSSLPDLISLSSNDGEDYDTEHEDGDHNDDNDEVQEGLDEDDTIYSNMSFL